MVVNTKPEGKKKFKWEDFGSPSYRTLISKALLMNIMSNAINNFDTTERRDLYAGFYSIIYDIMDEYSPEIGEEKELAGIQILTQHLNYYAKYIVGMSNEKIQLLKIEKEVNSFFNK